MADLFTFASSSLPDDIIVVRFHGLEAISTPYAYEIHFVAPHPDDLDLDDAIGQKATLTIDRQNEGDPLRVHGILASVHHLREDAGRALVRATLVPLLWHLSESEHSRLFTNKKLSDIVKDVLEGAGLTSKDYEIRVQRDLPIEQHVCQYRESDLAFLQRWFEREGLFYYFEQGDDLEKLIVTDANPSETLAQKPVRYHPTSGHDATAGECFDGFTCERGVSPATVRLKDYDYAKPSLTVRSETDVSKVGQAERVRFGQRFFTPADGDRLAKVQAEALRAQNEVVHATGTQMGLRAGYTFDLEDHPRGPFNKTYLITHLDHTGVNHQALSEAMKRLLDVDSDEVYRATVRGVDRATPYRAPLSTPWPRIYGTELAIVDGEAKSEYAQLDDQGRYLVRMMFDESDLDDGKTSTWVRMSQPHGGTKEGFHFPLRKGTEVMMTFLGGDPDRPVISGVVPNAERPSPVTRVNHTQNRIFTGGDNKIEIDDLKDKQYIHIATPRQDTHIHMGEPRTVGAVGAPELPGVVALGLKTDGDSGAAVGGNWYIGVGKNKTETVTGTVDETYGPGKTESVGGPVDETYKGPHNTTVLGGGLHEDVTGGHTFKCDSIGEVTYGGNYTFQCAAMTDTSGARTVTVNGAHTELVSGAEVKVIGGPTSWTHGGPTTWTSGGLFSLVSGGPINFIAPQINMLQPSQNSFYGKYCSTGALKIQAYGAVASFAVAKLDFSAVSVAITTGLKIDIRGFYLQSQGMNMGKTGFKTDCGALQTLNFGLLSFN